MLNTETDPVVDIRRRRRDQLLDRVGRDRRVLVVEPADGLAAELAAHGCEVVEGPAHRDGTGIDEAFDVVVLEDLLARVDDPQGLLKHAASSLGEAGTVVATATNSAHAAHRLAALGGRSPDPDGAPARWFTPDTLCELLESADLVIDSLHAVVLDPLDVDPAVGTELLPAGVVEWVRHQPDAMLHSLTVVGRPRGVDEDAAPRPPVQCDRPLSGSRRVDEHTEQARALQEVEHRLLTTRDAIIGLEQSTLLAELRRDQALDAVKIWKKRSRKWRTAHDELAAEVVRVVAEERRPAAALQALADRCRALVDKGGQDVADDQVP